MPTAVYSVGMEGFADKVKSALEAIKSKISPKDHDKIVSTLAKMSTLRQVCNEVKTKISQHPGNEVVTKSVAMITKRLPVSGNNPKELVTNLAAHRKNITMLTNRLIAAKNPDDVAKLRQELVALLNKKSEPIQSLTVCKTDLLKIVDEVQALGAAAETSGKEYLKAYDKAKSENGALAMEAFFTCVPALESYDDSLDVSLESAVSYLFGLMLLAASLFIYVVGIYTAVLAILLLFIGQFAKGAVLGATGLTAMWLGSVGLDAAGYSLEV